MKRIYSFVLIAVLGLSACSKKDDSCPAVNVTAPAAETAAVKAYLDANNLTATLDPRGFYYTIVTPGSDPKPSPCNDITIRYVGKLTNEKVFDNSNDIRFSLSTLILGWQEGIPLIGSGGSIILYLPPSLGYGSVANGQIPANSILIFTVDLRSFR